MRTIKLTVQYDGTNYCGWQEQQNGLSIQQVLEEALKRILGFRVRVKSSGRTDAGVHALAMPAVFEADTAIPLRAFVEGVNNFLPEDIAVIEAVEVPEGFRPIGDARSKHYRYTILNAKVRHPLQRIYAWHVRDSLNMEAMAEAAAHFAGRHNFAAFRASNCSAATTIRRIDSVTVSREQDIITIDVVGEGFMRNMVRIMAGTLVDVGKGRFAPDHIAWLLKNPARTEGGVTAPARGLCLMNVNY